MMRHRISKMLFAGLAIVMLAACSGTEGSPGAPTQPGVGAGSSTPSSASKSGPDAPRVGNPLDVSAVKSDPCAALSSQQLQDLGLKSGETDNTDRGADCEWEYSSYYANQVVFMLSDELSGLADIYARKSRLAYFEPTTIAGYPAVYAAEYNDRDRGRCMLHIGLTNDFAPAVFTQLSEGTGDYGRPCEVAEMTGTAIVKNLKGDS